MTMLPKIIFDFDGVLVDSERFWEEEEQRFFHANIKNWKPEDHNLIVGMTMNDAFQFLQNTFGLSLARADFVLQYDGIAERVYEQCAPMPGVREFTERVSKNGMGMAIASSGRIRWIEHVLRKFGLYSLFPIIVSAEDMRPGDGKPSPTIYLLCASKLGVRAEECIAIEDAKNGITAAKDAGMKCIALRTSMNRDQDLSRADLEIQSFSTLSVKKLRSL